MFKKSAPGLLLGTLLLAVPLASTAQDSGKGEGKSGSTTVVPTVGGTGKVSVESLVQRYLPLAGSHTNAQSLVNGLRDGNEVTLSGTVQEQVRVPVQTQVTEAVQVPVQTQVTETVMVPVRKPAPPPALPGTFITVMQPQTVTKTVTTYKTEYVTKTVTTYKMETITKPIITNFTPPTGNMGLGNVDIALALTEAVLTQQNIATPTIYQLQNALMDPNNGVLQLRAKKMGWGDIAKTLGFEVK
jgi:hypothetical protein